MFFKRLSRTRTDSYLDDYDSPRAEKYDSRPDSSRQHQPQPSRHNSFPPEPPNGVDDSYHDHSKPDHTATTDGAATNMYPRRSVPQDAGYGSRGPPPPPAPAVNGHALTDKAEPTPDLLTQAFNQALRPYTEKIEQMEEQMRELQSWADSLQQQRAELWEWIDKRGLRPDVPLSIAQQMDTVLPDAAATLNAQLDRKITIVNFDLHRLQDDLNDSISASHFAAAMAKFIPDISRLASLPTGPRFAFDLILKLGGNLNSHGGVEASAAKAASAATTGDGDHRQREVQQDLQARRDFYAQLDGAMVDVVRRRFAEGEDWLVGREIKRIEKTAAYLRTFGVEPYFPATLDALKREMDFRGSGGGPPPHGTPPRYQ